MGSIGPTPRLLSKTKQGKRSLQFLWVPRIRRHPQCTYEKTLHHKCTFSGKASVTMHSLFSRRQGMGKNPSQLPRNNALAWKGTNDALAYNGLSVALPLFSLYLSLSLSL